MSKNHPAQKKSLIIASAAIFAGSAALSGLSFSSASATDGSPAVTMSQPMPPMPAMQAADGHYYTQSATDLRVAMNNLLREHVTTSLDATRAIVRYTNKADIDATIASQYANTDSLAAAVGSVYGDAAQAQFKSLWNEHIYESNKYAMAVAEGDDSGKQAAFMELQGYLHELASFFSTAIPGLQEQDVYGMFNEHEELINKSTEAYKAGDFVQSYQLEREALKQISMAADALSTGIITTQPAKFE